VPGNNHERETARYFGVKRRNRGDDFGRSDIEVLVDVNTWSGVHNPREPKLLVECKYRNDLGIVPFFKEFTSKAANIPILSMGNYFFCYLTDFAEIYMFLIDIYVEREFFEDIHKRVSLLTTDKQLPQYIEEYTRQAADYSSQIPESSPRLPLVCLQKARIAGKIICFSLENLKQYRRQLEP
jgi:hypothetical protein